MVTHYNNYYEEDPIKVLMGVMFKGRISRNVD